MPQHASHAWGESTAQRAYGTKHADAGALRQAGPEPATRGSNVAARPSPGSPQESTHAWFGVPGIGAIAREEMIAKHAPLVKRVVDRLPVYLPPTLDPEDLLGYGTVGLIEAVNRFDPSSGVPFEVFAAARIRGAVLDALRAQSWVPRATRDRAREIAAAAARLETEQGRASSERELAAAASLNLSQLRANVQVVGRTVVSLNQPLIGENGEPVLLEDILADPDAQDPAEATARTDLLEHLTRALEKLPERDRILLSLYYVEELTMREIAETLRITKGRVCQLHSSALLRLRALLESPQDSGPRPSDQVQGDRRAQGQRSRPTCPQPKTGGARDG